MIRTPKRETAGGEIRVLVVDDSSLMRSAVTHALSGDPEIKVVGSAANGVIGLQKIRDLQPEAITLDVEMPEMNGLDMLRELRVHYPNLIVIMLSTLIEPGAATTVEALLLGANDYVAKPTNQISLEESLTVLRKELVPKIKQFFKIDKRQNRSALFGGTPKPCSVVPAISQEKRVLAIGASTGGPNALATILPMLPASFSYPVLIVQHMPALFTQLLAERLQKVVNLQVSEARHGTIVRGGEILIAPGGLHMKVARKGTDVVVQIDDSPPQNSCRPSVDVLFESVNEVYGGGSVATILTGMGRDGLRGTELLKRSGGCVIVQDEESSVVWGMPGAIVKDGLADVILPLECIVPDIVKRFCVDAKRACKASK